MCMYYLFFLRGAKLFPPRGVAGARGLPLPRPAPSEHSSLTICLHYCFPLLLVSSGLFFHLLVELRLGWRFLARRLHRVHLVVIDHLRALARRAFVHSNLSSFSES